MRVTQVRVAHLEDHYRREQLVSLIERALPVVGKHAEVIALYVILCLFWGLILYTAFVGLP
jgi:hypothetical protein